MKILVISNYFTEHAGGIEYVASNLVSCLRNTDLVHWMACDVKQPSHKVEEGDILLDANNFSEIELGFPYPVPALKSIPKIIREVRWCDVVHLHDCLYLANVIAFVFSRIFKKPVLITQHISPVPYNQKYKNVLQWIAYRTIGRFVLENSEKVVFISERVQSWFCTHLQLSRKSVLLMNGVDRTIFYPPSFEEKRIARQRLYLPEEGPVLLFVGRFTEKKGLKMIEYVARHRPNYLWVLVGRMGDVHPSDWNLSNVVVILQVIQKVLRDYYIAADLLVLPSIGEGLPLVVQEAMMSATPVLVSDETRDALPNAPVLSVQSSNSSNLLSTLDLFLSNPAAIKDLRDRVSVYSTNMWSWEDIAFQYRNLYLELIKQGSIRQEFNGKI